MPNHSRHAPVPHNSFRLYLLEERLGEAYINAYSIVAEATHCGGGVVEVVDLGRIGGFVHHRIAPESISMSLSLDRVEIT